LGHVVRTEARRGKRAGGYDIHMEFMVSISRIFRLAHTEVVVSI
jgi:hypothetical protein